MHHMLFFIVVVYSIMNRIILDYVSNIFDFSSAYYVHLIVNKFVLVIPYWSFLTLLIFEESYCLLVQYCLQML